MATLTTNNSNTSNTTKHIIIEAKKIIPSITYALAFIFFTITVKIVDVQAIGPLSSEIGFAKLNSAVNNFFSEHQFLVSQDFWYTLTNVFGIVAILTAAVFACIGLLQLIKRRSLLKVDREILTLGIAYALTIVLYVLFEKIAVNYRPILEDGELAASYPSTHTMIVLCILGTARLAFRRYIGDKRLLLTTEIICWVVMGLTVLGRLACGVHWLTDIIGGMIVSAAIVSFYGATMKDSSESATSTNTNCTEKKAGKD